MDSAAHLTLDGTKLQARWEVSSALHLLSGKEQRRPPPQCSTAAGPVAGELQPPASPRCSCLGPTRWTREAAGPASARRLSRACPLPAASPKLGLEGPTAAPAAGEGLHLVEGRQLRAHEGHVHPPDAVADLCPVWPGCWPPRPTADHAAPCHPANLSAPCRNSDRQKAACALVVAEGFPAVQAQLKAAAGSVSAGASGWACCTVTGATSLWATAPPAAAERGARSAGIAGRPCGSGSAARCCRPAALHALPCSRR